MGDDGSRVRVGFFNGFYGVSMVSGVSLVFLWFLWFFYGFYGVSMVFHGNFMDSIGPKSTESFSP